MKPVTPSHALPALVGVLSLAACGIFASGARTGTREASATPRWVEIRRTRTVTDGGAGTDAGARVASSFARCPEGAAFIPAGTFTMGVADDAGAPDERPAHRVTLRAYCIDRTEMTVGTYVQCVTARACPRIEISAPSPELPMAGIDWEQATSVCRFLGGRLPTEAEWERAARGTDGRRYPWGEEPPSGCAKLDWTSLATGGACNGVGPSVVGSFPEGASPEGVLDLAGNVWEWTADWYQRTYDATEATDPVGPPEGSARVTRGGGWNNDQADRFRTTWREGQHPAFHDYDLGARCAYDVAP